MSDSTTQPYGLSIPFRIANGHTATAAGLAKIEENLVHILLSRQGERPMRREFGSGLHDLLHDPDDDTLRALLRHRLATAERWEPRISVVAVDIERRDEVLLVSLGYVLHADDEYRTLTVPVPAGLAPA